MKKITKYATFVYEKEDEDLIEELEKQINSCAESIFSFFDSTLPRELVNITIFPSKQMYDEVVKKRRGVSEIPKWEIGNNRDANIEYVSLHDYKNTTHAFEPEEYEKALDYYKKTIIHEYVHFIVGLYRKKYNFEKPLKYLNEGIAQHLSGQRENIKQVFNYTLDDVLNSKNNYVAWYLMTKFIIDTKGRDYFLELLRNRKKAEEETPYLYEQARDYYNKGTDLKKN